MCYTDRNIGFSQNDHKNKLSKASTKTYYLQSSRNLIMKGLWILCNQCYLIHNDYKIRWFWCIFQTCQKVIDNHAHRKKNYERENHKPFVNKRFSKAIMQRTRFRNIFLRNLTDENGYIYIKQCHLFVLLCKP